MALKLMYITNEPQIARIAQDAGVDRIFIDMETVGKSDRQGGMDTVQSSHSIEDVRMMRECVDVGSLFVRVNSIHKSIEYSHDYRSEIESVIDAGADVVMLPFFKSPSEVQEFIQVVDGRVRTSLLVETLEAVDKIDEILDIPGIDEIHIGLNDLSLALGMSFMFNVLSCGLVDKLCDKIRIKDIDYGFGGVASPGRGTLPAECIIAEHYRLGSGCVILSRAFCNTDIITDIDEIKDIFTRGVRDIRAYESICKAQSTEFFRDNKIQVQKIVESICTNHS